MDKKNYAEKLSNLANLIAIFEFFKNNILIVIVGGVTVTGGLVIKFHAWICEYFTNHQVMYILLILVLVVIIAIQFILLIYSHEKNKKLLVEKNKNILSVECAEDISDIEFYGNYAETYIIKPQESENKKLQDCLKKGEITFYGDDVKNQQEKMLKSMHGNVSIYATDITVNPSLLIGTNRMEYNLENVNFIKNGGSILRLFILSEDKFLLEDMNYVINLYRVFHMNESYGVEFRIIMDKNVKVEQKVDMIIYSDIGCIIEERQLNANSNDGFSTLCFRKAQIQDKKMIFDKLWNHKVDTKLMQMEFMNCFYFKGDIASAVIRAEDIELHKRNYEKFLKKYVL